MKLEFHQLDRRHEHLRVRNAQRQRQLLASLATAGQQTPIIFVALSDQPDRYLVIDGIVNFAGYRACNTCYMNKGGAMDGSKFPR
jgi:hypothetical protein